MPASLSLFFDEIIRSGIRTREQVICTSIRLANYLFAATPTLTYDFHNLLWNDQTLYEHASFPAKMICFRTVWDMINCHAEQYVPAHLPGHWILMVINWGKKQIHCYDSLRQKRPDIISHFSNYVRDVHQHFEVPYLSTEWKLFDHHSTTPPQLNRFDCGPHVIWNAYSLARGDKLTPLPASSDAFRSRLARCCMNGRFTF